MEGALGRADHDVTSAHRDNSYLLFVLKEGDFRVIIDFEESVFAGPACCLIHPDQVHGVLAANQAIGWILAFNPGLLTQEVITVIAHVNLLTFPAHPSDSFARIDKLVELLWQTFPSDPTRVDQPLTIRYLLNALLSMLASVEQAARPVSNARSSRSGEITVDFRQLLNAHFSTWKRPAQYAQQLHLSVNHLNDMVKETTGYSVSYWIHHQTMLEARRQLYHTQQTIKEIAYQLGFEDQHYFSRLFRKVTGQTPVAFRQSFRDLFTKNPL